MRNIWFACLFALIAGGLAASPARAGDQVRIVGSSSVFPFASEAAEHFGRIGGFKSPVVEAIGSGGGFKLFCASLAADSPDIAAASRQIRQSERTVCESNGVDSILELAFGFDGVVIANAHEAAPLVLTHGQLYHAIAKFVAVNGKWEANPYRRWRDIDPSLPDMPIKVFGPAPNHGTRDSLVDLVLEQSCEADPASQQLDARARDATCQAVREDGLFIDVSQNYAITLHKLVQDREAVGILPFSYFDQNRDKIQAATFEGRQPTYETIFDESYPLSRKLYLYVKISHYATTHGLADYLKEFTSEKAWSQNGYMADKGLIALSDDQRREQADKLRRSLVGLR